MKKLLLLLLGCAVQVSIFTDTGDVVAQMESVKINTPKKVNMMTCGNLCE